MRWDLCYAVILLDGHLHLTLDCIVHMSCTDGKTLVLLYICRFSFYTDVDEPDVVHSLNTHLMEMPK